MFFPWSSLLLWIVSLKNLLLLCNRSKRLSWRAWPDRSIVLEFLVHVTFVTTRPFFRIHSLCEHLTFFPRPLLALSSFLIYVTTAKVFFCRRLYGHKRFVCDLKVYLENSKKINYILNGLRAKPLTNFTPNQFCDHFFFYRPVSELRNLSPIST